MALYWGIGPIIFIWCENHDYKISVWMGGMFWNLFRNLFQNLK